MAVNALLGIAIEAGKIPTPSRARKRVRTRGVSEDDSFSMSVIAFYKSKLSHGISQSRESPYASAAGRSLCHPLNARWKRRFVGTIRDR
jgi:hypothetical protein